MTKSVDTVLFDLDDTLCEYRRSGRELLSVAFDAHPVEPFFTVEDYYARYGDFSESTDSVEELRTECFAAIADERGHDPDLGRAIADTYTAERDHRNVRFLPGAREAVTALADDHRLGVVTNGAPGMQAKKLAALDLDDTFETVVHAGYDAPAKPDPAPFHAALSTLDGTPERAVHVGNSLASDVAGAQAAGIKTVWLDDGSKPDPVPDYTLASMDELTNPPWQA
jgi:HAD superfamily hydrolase (TIGR01509 family)